MSHNTLTIRDTNSQALNQSIKEEKNPKAEKILDLTVASQIECGICMNAMYNAVSLYPCLHAFCAGCICRWFFEKQICPMCRVPSSELMINRQLRDLVDKFLVQNPEQEKAETLKFELNGYELSYLDEKLRNKPPLNQYALRFDAVVRESMMEDIERYKYKMEKEMLERYTRLRLEKLDNNGRIVPAPPNIPIHIPVPHPFAGQRVDTPQERGVVVPRNNRRRLTTRISRVAAPSTGPAPVRRRRMRADNDGPIAPRRSARIMLARQVAARN